MHLILLFASIKLFIDRGILQIQNLESGLIIKGLDIKATKKAKRKVRME
jgi:hypothetical protein